jgi:hypothetical protein
MKGHISTIWSKTRVTVRRHPFVAGVVGALIGTAIFNTNSLLAVISVPLLLFTLPCLIMMAFCMKHMRGGKQYDKPSKNQGEASTAEVSKEESFHA